jgi:hypothetical protein
MSVGNGEKSSLEDKGGVRDLLQVEGEEWKRNLIGTDVK